MGRFGFSATANVYPSSKYYSANRLSKEMKDSLKLCIDCTYYRKSAFPLSYPTCMSPHLGLDLVTARALFSDASKERQSSSLRGNCGIEAIYFKKKEKDEDSLSK